MTQPEQGKLTLDEVNINITNGDIVIPIFQRDFVWPLDKSALLLDSWVKGYPMGAFILWVSKEKLATVKDAGLLKVNEKKNKDNPYTYVLDGQQRITSVYAARNGLKDGSKDFSKIVLNLDASETDEIITVLPENPTFTYISFKDLLDCKPSVVNQYSQKYIEKIEEYHDNLQSFSFPTIKMTDCDLNTATEVFTRLNTGGKALTVFEIMNAKTYEKDKFELEDKIKKCIKAYGTYLDYDKYKMILLQAVSVCLKSACDQKTILSIGKKDFIDKFGKVTEAFGKAVNFFKNTLKIPNCKLIPYSVMLLPYTYFFYNLRGGALETGTIQQKNKLIDYFLRCVLTERFQSATETRIKEDIKNVMDKILKNKPASEAIPVQLDVKNFISNGEFKMKSAYIKGLICHLIACEPSSIYDNSKIDFDKSWPIQANSRNYHHFFPRKMKNLNQPEYLVNNIVNIILLDATTNQIKIGDRNPSDYIAEFMQVNPQLQQTLKNHLISDINDYGILKDDFNLFINKRASQFIKSLEAKLITTNKDIIDSDIK